MFMLTVVAPLQFVLSLDHQTYTLFQSFNAYRDNSNCVIGL